MNPQELSRRAAPWLVGSAVMAAAFSSHATEVYQVTSAILTYTTQAKPDVVFGTGTDDEKMASLRLEHYGVHGFGDNYFFFEDFRGKNIGNIPAFSAAGFNSGSFADNTSHHYLGVWVPRISLSKVTGVPLSAGIVSDVYLAGRIERSDYANYRANFIGISLDLKLPGFAFFETDLFSRSDSFTGDTSTSRNLFSRTYFILPFSVGGLNFKLTPLILLNKRKDDRDLEVFIQPDLWVQLGTKSAELGLRIEHHRYDKTAAEGGGRYSRTSPTVMLKWNF